MKVFISFTLLISTFALLISPDRLTPLLPTYRTLRYQTHNLLCESTSSVNNLAPLDLRRKVA